MNVKIETKAAQFLFWENLVHIFGIVSLRCVLALRYGRGPTIERGLRWVELKSQNKEKVLDGHYSSVLI
jgi:hypothetical protein